MNRIRKIFTFEAAHRLVGSYSTRCQGIHGHSYKVEVILENSSLDETGMVMDFKKLKDEFHKFIDNFDHSLIIWKEDKALTDVELLNKLNPRWMIVSYNVTAENMAKHIFEYLVHILKFQIHSVKVHETSTGYAEYVATDIFAGFKPTLLNVQYSDELLLS